MSLIQAVRFRFLAAQLTSIENNNFVNILLHKNSDIVVKALFYYILHHTNQQSNEDHINDIISTIIQSRLQKPKTIPTKNIKLNQFPKILIGFVASFLDQYDYSNFSQTSRFIYIGCNSPNLLQRLDVTFIRMQTYSSINLKLFQSIKCLRISLTQCAELFTQTSGSFRMKQLKGIELIMQRDQDIHSNPSLLSNFINVKNITQLRVARTNKHFSSKKFMKILETFPNVQHLALDSIPVKINVNNIAGLYSNLKGLQLNGGILIQNRELIAKFGCHLEFLSFFGGYDSNFDYHLDNINFSQLQKLQLILPSNKSINNLLKTAKNLKKIFIVGSASSLIKSNTYTPITSTHMKAAISKFITSCKSLEFVRYWGNGIYLTSILNGIANGLSQTKNRERIRMKIHIITALRKKKDEFNSTNFVCNILKIIKWFECSELKDFMLIWELIRGQMDTSSLLQALKSKCSPSNIVVDLFGKRLVIANKHCKIDGLIERSLSGHFHIYPYASI